MLTATLFVLVLVAAVAIYGWTVILHPGFKVATLRGLRTLTAATALATAILAVAVTCHFLHIGQPAGTACDYPQLRR